MAIADSGNSFDYNVGLEDVGRDLSFSCKWRQIVPGGELLYSGTETSRSISITLTPTIGNKTETRQVSTKDSYHTLGLILELNVKGIILIRVA